MCAVLLPMGLDQTHVQCLCLWRVCPAWVRILWLFAWAPVLTVCSARCAGAGDIAAGGMSSMQAKGPGSSLQVSYLSSDVQFAQSMLCKRCCVCCLTHPASRLAMQLQCGVVVCTSTCCLYVRVRSFSKKLQHASYHIPHFALYILSYVKHFC